MYDNEYTPKNSPEDEKKPPVTPEQSVPFPLNDPSKNPAGASPNPGTSSNPGAIPNSSAIPNTPTNPQQQTGAYRSGREQQQEPWRASGGFQSTPQQPITQPVQQRPQQTGPVFQQGGPTGGAAPRQKAKKKGGWAKVAVLVIAGSLVFGTAGGYLGATIANSGNSVAASTQSTTSFRDTSPSTSSTSDDSGTVTNTSAVTGETLTGTQIYALASEQVVSITATGVTTSIYGQSEAASMGTGFVISEDGYIMTNYHVISLADSSSGSITVSFKNGDSYSATLVGGYSDGDVALLKIDATGLNAVTFGDSNEIAVGENIYVVGNALGTYDYTQTSGIVSGLDRDVDITDSSTNETVTMNMFQIDAAVNSGNSGGPVYNSRGEVIGIVTSKLSSSYSTSSTASIEGLGFAIPINDAVSIADEIKNYGYVAGSPIIGISGKTVTSDATEYGIPAGTSVEAVTSGGAAEKAGIQAKDIITKIDDTEITSISDLKKALKKYSVGDTVTVTLYRGGEYIEVEVTFTETENSSATTQEESQSQSGNSSDSSGSFGGYGGFGR